MRTLLDLIHGLRFPGNRHQGKRASAGRDEVRIEIRMGDAPGGTGAVHHLQLDPELAWAEEN
jgi:hypothetical protein